MGGRVDDGQVTINGRSAIDVSGRRRRAYGTGRRTSTPACRAGRVPGPRLRPVVHPPGETGKWLRHILARPPGQAQSDGDVRRRSEKQQILAFAYGYATHAAGDMWAHTFVNDFAEGVFPSVFGIITGSTTRDRRCGT